MRVMFFTLFACYCFVCYIAATRAFVIREIQKEAIDRGHAEWRIIPGTSKTEFKWKDDQ
jgi:hypothetical protein